MVPQKTPPPDGTSGGDVRSSGVRSDQYACGRRGAVVWPLFEEMGMGTG